MGRLKLAGEPEGVSDHGLLDGLEDDDHAAYALLSGRSGGQTLSGSNAAGEGLTLQSTTDASKGKVIIPDTLKLSGLVVEDSDDIERIRLGTASPHIKLTGNVHLDLDTIRGGMAIGPAAPGGSDMVKIDAGSLTLTGSDSLTILSAYPSAVSLEGTNQSVSGVGGYAVVKGTAGTGASAYGLNYSVGRSGSLGLSDLVCMQLRVNAPMPGSGTTSNVYFLKAMWSWGSTSIPTYVYGILWPLLTRGTNRFHWRAYDPTTNLGAGDAAYGIQMDAFDASAQGTQWPFHYGDIGSLLWGITRLGVINAKESGTPTTPASGYRGLYPKSDGWYDLDSGGTETKLGGGTVGWHGSGTRIKLTPAEMATDYLYDDQAIGNNGGSINKYVGSGNSYWTVAIPTGYKATHVRVNASGSVTVTVYECDIANSTATSKGTGNTNTDIDITDVTSTTTNYLSIQVPVGANDIYGGYVAIAQV